MKNHKAGDGIGVRRFLRIENSPCPATPVRSVTGAAYPRKFVCYGALAFLTLFLLLVPAPRAAAHKVMIFAWVDGNTVYTESKFSGGKKVKGGRVTVYDMKGKRLLDGKTDDQGAFSFKVPAKTALKLVLSAGMGHRGEWTVPLEDIEAASAGGTVSARSRAPSPEKTASETGARVSGPAPDDVEAAVERALDRKLRPVLKMLAESREHKPAFSDILGGIGYILGLMGVGAYFNYRRKLRDPDGGKD